MSNFEDFRVVTGLAPITPSTSTPDYVSMKGYGRCSVIIIADNATTVTGSAITLKQATAVAGTSEKELAFATMHANTDTAAADTMVDTDVTSNTFTTDATNNKNLLYRIEVKAEDLDVANGFDCIRAGTANATATVLSVIYILWEPRYAKVTPTSAITD